MMNRMRTKSRNWPPEPYNWCLEIIRSLRELWTRNPRKLKIALRLRKETTMTLGWIAEKLLMGTKTHVSHLLYWQAKGRKHGRRVI